MEIPNGISTADLANLLDDAPDENTCNCSDSDRLTQNQIEELACDFLDAVMDDINAEDCTLLHKVICLMAISRFKTWHETLAENMVEEGIPFGPVKGWLLDAGKLQACGQLLQSVSVSDDDFTCAHA